jgi:hypothetical protein
MFKLPSFYNKKKVLLALEFGLAISEVAKKMEVELTKEIVERAENIFLNEIETRGEQQIANDFTALILASFEVN